MAGLGGGKHLEVSCLHIGTSTYTRVLCATKTVPSGRKHPYLGQTPLKISLLIVQNNPHCSFSETRMSLSQEFIEKSKFSIQMCFFRKILVRSLIELET